jgi:predicted GNAT family acetyltransferase
MLNIRNFTDAQEFLQAAGVELERSEAANGLLLGVGGQLLKHPERFKQPVCMKVVEEGGDPVLAALMTPPRSLLLAGKPDRPAERLAVLAETLVREGWDIPGVFGPEDLARAMVARLDQIGGKRYRLDRELRMYELRKVELPPPARGRLRKAVRSDLDRIAAWWYEASQEMNMRSDPEEAGKTAALRIGDGEVFVWEDGGPVSMASKTRPTRRGISVGMVFTPPDRRRRGYATACVGELSRLLLREGRAFCALYADLSNPVSNSIYRKIGYRPIGDCRDYGSIEQD